MSNYRSSSSQDGSRSYRGGGSSGGYRGGGSGGGGYQGKSRGGRGSRGGYQGGYQGKSRGGGGSRGGYQGKSRGSGNYHWSSRDNYSADPRSRLNDDDIAMDGDDVGQGAPPRSRYNPYGQRPNRQYDRGGNRGSLAMDRSSRGAMDRLGYNSRGGGSSSNNSRRTNLSSSGWYQVTIPHGAKEDKDWLLRQLAEMCEMPFVPVNYHLQGNNVSFNVNDKQSADSLRQLSRKLTNKDGYKMIVLTRACNPPFSALDEATTEKLKVCMSRRYDPATKSLDLSNLYNDDEMKREGIQVAMSRHGVMVLIVKIIQEHIPELQSLNLKDNRLFKLDDLQPLATKAPNLSKLSLEKNGLKHENLLHPIQSLQLDELCLDGNPLCDRFSDEKSYIR